MTTPRRNIDSLVSIASGDRLDLSAFAEPPAWYGDALCPTTDPEAFYPEKGGSTQPAKAVCLSCSVRSECLDYALENNEAHGVWGGALREAAPQAEEGRGMRAAMSTRAAVVRS